jgi:enolase-phosphatase E1
VFSIILLACAGMRHVLLDIEGTTTSIRFVYDELFPFAKRRLAGFVAERWTDPVVAKACTQVLADALPAEQVLPPLTAVQTILARQMAGDVKATGLKTLQGLVWREGYESGAVRGHVYPDVAPAFARWQAAGIPVAIYSSGSVLAQQLLFRHSVAGDLTPFLAGHYDTTTGPKRSAASYAAIAQAWGCAPQDITFGTDIPAEAEAARAAGCRAVVLLRPGNPALPAHLPFAVHPDLSAI